MSNRNLTILGIIAVVIVAIAVVQSHISSKPKGEQRSVAYLIQGLDPDVVGGITIGDGNEQVTLTRQRGKGFVVANLDNYPASSDEINKLISTCLDIQTAQLYTDDAANHKDLAITEQDARSIVKFFGADSNLVTGVVVGKAREQGRGTYVRRASDNSVYISLVNPWIKKSAMDYVSQELVNVKREDIESVTVTSPNDVYTLRQGADGKTITLDNIPQGKGVRSDIADSVVSALASLQFEDVRNESSSKDKLVFDRQFACKLRDSTVYTFRIASKDDKVWAACDGEFTDKTPVTKTQGEVESEEELKKKEAKLLARDSAEAFSESNRGWLYQIPGYRAENMTKGLSELLEDLARPQPDANEPNEPAQVGEDKQAEAEQTAQAKEAEEIEEAGQPEQLDTKD